MPPRSGSLDTGWSERHSGLNEWARSALVKMAVRLSLFGAWGAVAPHVVFQDSGEARYLVCFSARKSAVEIVRRRRSFNPSTASFLHNSTVSTVLNLVVS